MKATCAQCGSAFDASRRDRRFCSRKCTEASQPPCSEPDCARPRMARGLCKQHWKRAHGGPRKRFEITCQMCGCQHWHARPDGMYCSETCAQQHRRAPRKQLVMWVRPDDWAEQELARRAASLRPPRWFQSGQCRVCKAWFVSPHTHITCGDVCQRKYERDAKRDAKHRRRARLRNAYAGAVNRSAIYARDGYRCHICRKPLDMDAEVPAPLAPTIDHLIPLSKGGTHEAANVKAAHYICNVRRGDRVDAVQGLLFG